ncbi:hypothetical protein RYX36_006725 [Vicia faba]
MAETAQLTRHVESYVTSSSTLSHQAASLDAIGLLIKTNALTLEALVIGLDMYLTSTDAVIRSRGILLLEERKSVVGMVTGSDAKAIAQSFLLYLQVQSLGQYDRKLCFELIECLLQHHANAVASLEEDLVFGICEAIDAEKDPECLILAFHIVESSPHKLPPSIFL